MLQLMLIVGCILLMLFLMNVEMADGVSYRKSKLAVPC